MYNNQWEEHLPIAYLTNFQDGVYDAVILGKKDWHKGQPQGYSHGFAYGLQLCDEIDEQQKED